MCICGDISDVGLCTLNLVPRMQPSGQNNLPQGLRARFRKQGGTTDNLTLTKISLAWLKHIIEKSKHVATFCEFSRFNINNTKRRVWILSGNKEAYYILINKSRMDAMVKQIVCFLTQEGGWSVQFKGIITFSFLSLRFTASWLLFFLSPQIERQRKARKKKRNN